MKTPSIFSRGKPIHIRVLTEPGPASTRKTRPFTMIAVQDLARARSGKGADVPHSTTRAAVSSNRSDLLSGAFSLAVTCALYAPSIMPTGWAAAEAAMAMDAAPSSRVRSLDMGRLMDEA